MSHKCQVSEVARLEPELCDRGRLKSNLGEICRRSLLLLFPPESAREAFYTRFRSNSL